MEKEPMGESELDEQTQSASSLTAASAAGDTVLDASSLPAAGGKNTPLITPRPIMSGALVHRFLAYPTQKPKPTSNKETYPTQKPKSKSKASPMKYFLTPSTFKSCADAWEYITSAHEGPTQRQVFRRFYSQNSMIDGMFPEWPAGLTSEQYLRYAYNWMKAAGLKGTNTGSKIQVEPFDAWSEYSRLQFEHLAIVILDSYLFKCMPATGQWYKMYNGELNRSASR